MTATEQIEQQAVEISQLHKELDELRLQKRPGRHRIPIDPAKFAECLELGHKAKQIAYELGVSISTVRLVIKRAKINPD